MSAAIFPYFPIEFSRILASSNMAYWSFIVGLFCITPFLNWTSYMIAAWLAVFGIAVFDDKQYWLVHMLFVGVLMAIAFFKALQHSNTLYVFLMAMCLYFGRLVLKVGALYFLEHVGPSDWKQMSLRIMFGYVKNMQPGTRMAFQLGGVLQWIVLWMVGTILME